MRNICVTKKALVCSVCRDNNLVLSLYISPGLNREEHYWCCWCNRSYMPFRNTPMFLWVCGRFSFLCRVLFGLLSYFFWPFYDLSFFDLRLLSTPLASSNFSYKYINCISILSFVLCFICNFVIETSFIFIITSDWLWYIIINQ